MIFGTRTTWARAAGLAAALLLSGCRERSAAPAAPDRGRPLVREFSGGPVQAILTADPGTIRYERDVLLTLTLKAPAGIEVTVPSLDDRVQGFVLNGAFAEQPVVSSTGPTERRLRARLTPIPGVEHRIAPIPIVYKDTTRTPPAEKWFPTRAIAFDAQSPFKGAAGKDIDAALKPVWVRPTAGTILLWLAGLVAVAGLAALLAKLAGRVREQVRLARLSPRERAMAELAKLLARDLIAKDMVKEFYLELTMIVRRYIERAHAVRAPEQTTEEFLAAASRNARFRPEVLRKLRDFLEAADLVKFAAHRPPPDDIGRATGTAREYIETDAASLEQAAASAPPAPNR